MTKGFFISVEGGEGAGKTTTLQKLESFLIEKGFKVVSTREPGGIEIAEQIRSVILNPANTSMDGRTEALLYAAARRQHLVEKILPALDQGYVVLCDRFIDSSLAYQGFARGLGIEEIRSINSFAVHDCLPDLTLYFDLDPEVGLSRIHRDQNREVNRLDLEHLDFHRKVREGYLQLVNLFPERIYPIDAEQSKEKVFQQVREMVEQRLPSSPINIS